jgi:hypothetical protein
LSSTVEALKLAQRVVEAARTESNAYAEALEVSKFSRLPADVEANMDNWQRSHAILGNWEGVGRKVLAIDDELVSLLRYSSSSKVEPAVFRTLPYINPMVVFPSPPVLPSRVKGETYTLLGFFAAASRGVERELTSTHDPGADSFFAYCIVRIDRDDGTSDIEFDYTSFPLVGAPFTMKECVDCVLNGFVWMERGGDEPSQPKFMRELMTLIIGSVMYLCSTTLEAEKVPRKALLKHFPSGNKPPFSMYRVGWQIGAALSAARKTVTVDDPSQQTKPGYEQDPQHRRAHFKTVWTGKGSMTPKLVFIAPYWTHLEKLGKSGVNTVHGVKPPTK